MAEQKYQKGDVVHIVMDLEKDMSHFPSDIDAVVQGSYNDFHKKRRKKNIIGYSVLIRGRGSVHWYKESQLRLIEKNRIDVLKKWEKELIKGVSTRKGKEFPPSISDINNPKVIIENRLQAIEEG